MLGIALCHSLPAPAQQSMYQTDRDSDRAACAACIREYVLNTGPNGVAWEEAWACSEQYKQTRLHDDPLAAGDSATYSRPYSLAGVQAHLPANGVLLDFFVDDSVLFVFSISGTTMGGQVLGPESGWQKTLARFRDAAVPTDPKAAYDLYAQWLWPRLPIPVLVRNPIEATLAFDARRPLLIIPDESLAGVPLGLTLTGPVDSLSDDFATRPYLFREYDIRYGLSATSLLMKSSGGADAGFLAWVAAILILLIALAAYWQGRNHLLRRFARRSRSGSPPGP